MQSTRACHALYLKTSLCRTSPDIFSHAIAFSSRVSCQKLLTKARVYAMIFTASERVSLRSNQIFRGIAQLVEQRSPKPRAEGSSPSAPAKLKSPRNGLNKPFLGLFFMIFPLKNLTARGLKTRFWRSKRAANVHPAVTNPPFPSGISSKYQQFLAG